jgi:hypothetical protein
MSGIETLIGSLFLKSPDSAAAFSIGLVRSDRCDRIALSGFLPELTGWRILSAEGTAPTALKHWFAEAGGVRRNPTLDGDSPVRTDPWSQVGRHDRWAIIACPHDVNELDYLRRAMCWIAIVIAALLSAFTTPGCWA